MRYVLKPQHKKFCEVFAKLWHQQKQAGVQNPRVGRLAALAAGYGKNSWSESNAIQTADVVFNQLTKRRDVLQYLRELGFERDGRFWRQIEA